MEQINLSTHGKDIQKSYEHVVRGDGDFTWVIFGPDSSKAYHVAETGTDFDEFLQGFDESQIQFGLARVNPPSSDVFKNLLIGWCPDSAPLKSRSSFAQNFAEVSRLLKGYHVQVTARDSDDLDKQDLLSRLSAAAGARYSIQASRSNASPAVSSARPTPKPFVPKPATSIPKPAVSKPTPAPVKKEEPQIIKPAVSKKIVVEEDEWNEPEVQERDLTKEPLKPNVPAWKPIGKVNLQEVIKEEKARPDPRLEVEQLKQKDRLRRDQELDDYLKTKSASIPVKAPLPSSDINKLPVSGGISKDFGSDNGKTPAQLWAERKQKAAGGSIPASEPINKSVSKEENSEVNVSGLKSKFDHLALEAEEEEKEEQVVPKRAPVPVSQPEEEEEEEQQPQEEEEEDEEEPAPTLPSRGAVPPPPPSRSTVLEEEEEPEPEAEPEVEEEEPEEDQGELIIAIAEYDYEASEDNELTFAEGQKIVNIQMIDEDWWLGELENGEKGLFPSNYVSLQ
jgi:hypothetical protein